MAKDGSRKHAQLLKRIWRDPHWKSLPVDAQWLYEALISQDTINFAGVIPLTDRRWANLATDMTRDRIETALKHLEHERFIVIDWDTEEVLVRTYIRNDELWKQPRMLRLALGQANELQSDALRFSLSDELSKLAPMVATASASGVPESAWPELAAQTQDVANLLVKDLEHLQNPRGNLGSEQDSRGGGSNGAGVVSSNYIHQHQAPDTDTVRHSSEPPDDDYAFPPEPPHDEYVPTEIGTGTRPPKPIRASPAEITFVRTHVGQRMPRDIENKLVTNARRLIRDHGTPVVEAALREWGNRDNAAPGLLASLVSDELRRGRATPKPSTTDQRVAQAQALKRPEWDTPTNTLTNLRPIRELE